MLWLECIVILLDMIWYGLAVPLSKCSRISRTLCCDNGVASRSAVGLGRVVIGGFRVDCSLHCLRRP